MTAISIKAMVISLLFTVTVPLVSFSMSSQVNASVHSKKSSWHNGTPKSLRGYWSIHEKEHVIRYTKVTPHTFTNATNSSGFKYILRVKYRYLGHHIYQLRGTQMIAGGDLMPGTVYLKSSIHKKLGVKNSIGAKKHGYDFFIYRHK